MIIKIQKKNPKIQAPHHIGKARFDLDKYDDEMRKKRKNEIRELFDLILESNKFEIHSFTFSMRVQYDKLRIKVDKIENLY